RIFARTAERHERAAVLHQERGVRREARPLVRRDRRWMAGGRPELRATRRDDDPQATDQRRAQTRVRRRRGEGVPLGVHRASERRVRSADALRDPRAVAGGAAPSLVAPGVAGRGPLWVRAAQPRWWAWPRARSRTPRSGWSASGMAPPAPPLHAAISRPMSPSQLASRPALIAFARPSLPCARSIAASRRKSAPSSRCTR